MEASEKASSILLKVVKIGAPAILSQIFSRLIYTINVLYVGRENKQEIISGYGMGDSQTTLIGYSIIYGLNTALATFIPQAYGLGNLRQCGIFMNRGFIIILMSVTISSFLLCFTEMFYRALNVNAEVAHHA
jgi:Na+-driven multidrug efflux pump